MSKKSVLNTFYAIIVVLVLLSIASITVESRQRIELSGLRNSGAVVEVNQNKGKFDYARCSAKTQAVLADFNGLLGSLERVVIHNDTSLRRGLSNDTVIYLRCLDNMVELENVLVHEIGHVIDLGYLVDTKADYKSQFTDFGKAIDMSDPSVYFYNISWESNQVLGSETNKYDFVSDYAMTDPFEDFAESLIVYRNYGAYFRKLISDRKSEALEYKYDFIKTKIFNGVEFDGSNYVALSSMDTTSSTLYDATKLYQVK